MKRLYVLAALSVFTSGCAQSTGPKVIPPPPAVIVKEAVTIQCTDGKPIVRPSSRLNAIAPGSGVFIPAQAALADRESTCAYVRQLEAAARACGVEVIAQGDPCGE